jgi:hypothetical protein
LINEAYVGTVAELVRFYGLETKCTCRSTCCWPTGGGGAAGPPRVTRCSMVLRKNNPWALNLSPKPMITAGRLWAAPARPNLATAGCKGASRE